MQSDTTTRQPGQPWDIRAASAYLGISPRHLHRLLETGSVKALRIGRRVFIADAEIQRVATQGTTPITLQ